MNLLGLVPAPVKMALLGAVLAAGGLLYWHYSSVVSQRDEALNRVAIMEVAKKVQDATIDSQREAIDAWKTAAAKTQETLNAMTVAQAAASKEARRLSDVLSKHNLRALSGAKPGLIERRINSGTARILGMFNCATDKCNNDSGESGASRN